MREKLEEARRVARRVASMLLEKKKDVLAVFMVGSVARGDMHETSDIDLCVIVEAGDGPRREEFREEGYTVDVSYVPFRAWMERLRRDVVSMWEIAVSNILDSIVLYDPKGIVRKIKLELSRYPEEKRRENILYHFHMIGWHRNAVKYHYSKRNYDYMAIFSKLYAIEALRILFPLNRVYLKGDKYLFDQVKTLKAPENMVEKCFTLLWFKAEDSATAKQSKSCRPSKKYGTP